jgi:hypothetical protein
MANGQPQRLTEGSTSQILLSWDFEAAISELNDGQPLIPEEGFQGWPQSRQRLATWQSMYGKNNQTRDSDIFWIREQAARRRGTSTSETGQGELDIAMRERRIRPRVIFGRWEP